MMSRRMMQWSVALVLLVLALVGLSTAPQTVRAQGGLPVANVVCDTYFRSGPSASAAPLDVMTVDEPLLLITGRDESGNWLVALRQNGQYGWVGWGECLAVQGNINNAPLTAPLVYDGPPVATIGCTQYLRSAANDSSARLLILYPDDGVLEILGRDQYGEWLLVRRADGAMGWVVDTQCIVVQGEVLNAPVTTTVEMPVPDEDGDLPPAPETLPAATIGCTQYIRSAANDASARLLILSPDDGILTILGRDESGMWLLVQRDDGAMGWVYDTNCIVVDGDVFDAPLSSVVMPVPNPDGSLPPTPADPNAPYATIGCAQYIRHAPVGDAYRLLILYPDDGVLNLLGRDESGFWLLVQRDDGAMGWVYDTSCIVVNGDVASLPVRTDITMTVPGILEGTTGVGPVEEEAAAAPVVIPNAGIPEPNARIACTQYIRSAADNDSARLLILYPADGLLEILARDRVAEWLLVRRADGAMGWVVNTTCIVVNGNVFDAPEDTSVVMPVPGAEPEEEAVPFPGALPPYGNGTGQANPLFTP